MVWYGMSIAIVFVCFQTVKQLRNGFSTGQTLDVGYRLRQLKGLGLLVEENREAILDALRHDLGKHAVEAEVTEVLQCTHELALAIKNIGKWTSPVSVPRTFLHLFNRAYIQPEPYGLVLIMGAWNYPFDLNFRPLIGAIAAGNACILKPSEYAVATSNLFSELIPRYLDGSCYAVVTGDVSVSKALLEEKFDYIFFTGGCETGRKVMMKAAERLTPVTLELGGKTPCIVADDAPARVAASRIIWGKCTNAGQSCIAPDYVLCSRAKQEEMVAACQEAIKRYYGDSPLASVHYGRIANEGHFHRLKKLLSTTSGTVAFGGEMDEEKLQIAPTLIRDVPENDSLMSEEVFGPLLPFVPVQDMDHAIEIVNSREKPLALYVFSKSSRIFERVRRETSAGGMTHNDCLMHYTLDSLPFGGVGNSGIGAYHGKNTFDTFSHHKSILRTGFRLEFLNSVRYPPYSTQNLELVKLFTSVDEYKFLFILLIVVLFIIAPLAWFFFVP